MAVFSNNRSLFTFPLTVVREVEMRHVKSVATYTVLLSPLSMRVYKPVLEYNYTVSDINLEASF